MWEQRLGAGAFRRGFVDGVTLGADVFLRTAPALFATAPVTELHLHGGYSDVNTLLASECLHRLRGVRLSGGWAGDRIARRFAKCPTLGAVRELDLSGCRLTDSPARSISCSARTVFGKLSTLRVRWNRLTGYGIDLLVQRCPALAALTQPRRDR